MVRQLPLPEPNPAKTRLYNEDYPKGKTFLKEEEAGLLLRGWRTCPTQVGKMLVPGGINARSSADDLINAVKAMGYEVTLEDIANQDKAAASPTATAPTSETSEPAIAETETTTAEASPASTSSVEMTELFQESPAQLSDAELLELGKDLGLDVRSNMKRETIIERIGLHLGVETTNPESNDAA